MSFVRTFIVPVATAFAGLLVFAASGSAQECAVGCALQKRECLVSARMAQVACKLDCRTNVAPADLRTCTTTCMATFRAAKDACRADHADCLGMCEPPADGAPDVEPCLGGCGQDLAACADGVIATARACVTGCTSAPDRLTCLQGCGADAQAGAGACADAFGTCRADCGVSTPTTTLPPPAACGPDSAGACGGTCPAGLTCQAPPPGSAIALACVCRP